MNDFQHDDIEQHLRDYFRQQNAAPPDPAFMRRQVAQRRRSLLRTQGAQPIMTSSSPTTENTPYVPPTHAAVPRRPGLAAGALALLALTLLALIGFGVFAHRAQKQALPSTKVSPTTAPTLAYVQASLTDISMDSPDDGWAVGSGVVYSRAIEHSNLPSPLLYHYAHGQWSAVQPPANLGNGAALYGVSMLSATDGWAVGMNRENTSTTLTNDIILHYDGIKWSSVTAPAHDNDLEHVQAFSDDNVWAASGENGGYPEILHFQGENWIKQTLPASIIPSLKPPLFNSILSRLDMLSPQEGWAAGYIITNSVPPKGSQKNGYLLHYYGGRWTVQYTVPNTIFYGMSLVSASEGWAAGWHFGEGDSPSTDMPALFHYHNGTWSEVQLPLGSQWHKGQDLGPLEMLSSTDGWMRAYEGNSLYQHDGAEWFHYDGTSWQLRTFPHIPVDATALSFTSPQEGWAVGGVDMGEIKTSGDPIVAFDIGFEHYVNGSWVAYTP
jgi:hypothetical protein